MTYDKFLYNRGFFLTDNSTVSVPFATENFWDKISIGNRFTAYIHKNTKIYVCNRNNSVLFLIGHAYNPFKMISDETIILNEIINTKNLIDFFQAINELTGLFLIGKVDDNGLLLVGDPTGMQCVFYGILNQHIYVASHTHMFEDVCNVQFEGYVTELVNYKFYPLFGAQLPGDITPYALFHRLIPNHYVELGSHINVTRFFPTKEYSVYTDEEIHQAEQRIANAMHNNLSLIAEKWHKPAISLTGGVDSKTTLACAAGLYDKYSYFSYISSDAEKVDAEAAHLICDKMGLQHSIYQISNEDKEFKDVEIVTELLKRNSGNIGNPNSNDVRKRIFFADTEDFDVEVKSWVSECGRAYYNKRFNKSEFPSQPYAHYLTSLYKVFVTNRSLIKQTDQIFESYIQQYLSLGLAQYPWQELFFWEFRMSAWNGLVITGEHKYSFDITIPYNNRIILDMLLRMPLDYRIHDVTYKEIRKIMNPIIDQFGISVTNIKHTKNRARMERLYLDIVSKLT